MTKLLFIMNHLQQSNLQDDYRILQHREDLMQPIPKMVVGISHLQKNLQKISLN
jgi:hypothetical protein